MKGWISILKRSWSEVGSDHIGLIAAGVAFYGLLALFPAITAFVALSGIILTPDMITGQIESMAAMLPQDAADIIIGQVTAVVGAGETGLGITALIGLGVALYSASRGVASLIEGMNVAYDEKETRGFVWLLLRTLALTIFLIIGLIAGLSATLVLPSIFALVNLGPTVETVVGLLRWAILFLMTMGGLMVLYRYSPDRSDPQWRWLVPGALVACVLWVVATIGFAIYVENFGSYNETFGTLGGAIVLLMWLWISSYIILFGAEINSEAEFQTKRDTTTGPDMPMGRRGAVKADNVPESF
jgi:membrane protein